MNGGCGISSGSVVIVVVVVVVRSGWGASRVWVRSEDGYGARMGGRSALAA